MDADKGQLCKPIDIVDAVTVGYETAAQSANIRKRIPIGAVAREPCHIDGQDQPTSLSPTRPTSSLKAPLSPRSASITSMSASCHPSSRAHWRSAY